ncbi:MAG: mevalonate kinase [Saprospiraceae bacterium]|nr:mevalonate kinase [Saprospiraceae bacterium]
MLKTYPSKLLLFGEYSIIKGSNALAVPHARYGGMWDWAEKPATTTLQQDLPRFAAWLEHQTVLLDFRRFQQDLAQGLYFRSNIPAGYGLGSSGALVAAVYERYACNPVTTDDNAQLPALRAELATLEGFFHASSSGIDPLISYLDRPVVLSEEGGVSVLSGVEWPREFRFFLINTQITRQTGPLVQVFLKKCQSEPYRNKVEEILKPLVNETIQAFLDGSETRLFDHVGHISRFQLEHFREMIPAGFLPYWQSCLEGEGVRIKLCGAGGGGFLLGLCRKDTVPGDFPWEWVR